uniref:Uncharacterized protein n=1 Tax=Arundo donax TaxID=35708 RepID=A0A0A9B165_ARUDO
MLNATVLLGIMIINPHSCRRLWKVTV